MNDEELEVGIAAGLDVPTAFALAEGDSSPVDDCLSENAPPPDGCPPRGCLSVLAVVLLILSAAAMLSF
jgi:hypothetical protein